MHNSSIIAWGGILNKEERRVARSLCFFFKFSSGGSVFLFTHWALQLKGDPATSCHLSGDAAGHTRDAKAGLKHDLKMTVAYSTAGKKG